MVYQVTDKDWSRMQDLWNRGQDGEGVAKKITSVEKAVARYVAGLKIEGTKEATKEGYNNSKTLPWSSFKAFGRRALELGATFEDLEDSFAAAQKPAGEDIKQKKVYSGYTGNLERLLDSLAKQTGWSWTWKTIENINKCSLKTQQMYIHNGRVWPISKEITFSKTGKEDVKVIATVVTSEGGGNYGYDFDYLYTPSFREFKDLFTRKILNLLDSDKEAETTVNEEVKKQSKQRTLTSKQYQDLVMDWLSNEGIDWEYVDAERGQVVNGVFCNYLRFPDSENKFSRQEAYEIAEKLQNAPANIKGKFMTVHAIHWENAWWIIWNAVDQDDYRTELEYGHDMKEDPEWNW